jgi:PilZ domain
MADEKTSLPGTPTQNAQDRRRSIRLHLAMPVIVRGVVATRPFEEKTQTITVSAYGCMLCVSAHVVRGQEVVLVNPTTAEELPCRVISLRPAEGDRKEIGLEFTESSPMFWRIAFPPAYWIPSERKPPPSTPPRSTPHR